MFFCCRKPYTPPVITAPGSYLVVEGDVNSGSDSTTIRLSKTVNINAQVTLNPVGDAVLTVVSDQNTTYPLVSDGKGNYVSAGLNLPVTGNYHLQIVTGDGKKYASAAMPVKNTPPIDSIGYNIVNKGIQVYVNTHDPKNNTHYYRWEYAETWKFHAKYFSSYIFDPVRNGIFPRSPAQQNYYCYTSDASSNLVLTSTAKLSQDLVYQTPLTDIPFTSEKIETEYSILVRQYALTGDEYHFYQTLKNNTENLGSIFDAQPSQLIGNIHNVADANEPVIGYVAVTNAQTKRVFLTNSVVPNDIPPTYPYDCLQDTALYLNKFGQNDVLAFLSSSSAPYFPTSAVYGSSTIIGYEYSTLQCTDCTIRGKTAVPSFWK